MTRLGLPESLETWNALVAAHREPTRHYHNVEHVTRCLDLVDEFREQIPNADLVELAFWFHDAVYNPQSKSNEADSAAWAERFLADADMAKDTRQTVDELIMATQHRAEPLTIAQQWMVDIDLAILGAEPDRFDQYERDIRREYQWVPEEQFRQGRAALLEVFLQRKWIFNTAVCRDRFEANARLNLQRSIERLNA